jgi:hypothetical protein
MLATAEAVAVVAGLAAGRRLPALVDPVMVTSSGDRLLERREPHVRSTRAVRHLCVGRRLESRLSRLARKENASSAHRASSLRSVVGEAIRYPWAAPTPSPQTVASAS